MLAFSFLSWEFLSSNCILFFTICKYCVVDSLQLIKEPSFITVFGVLTPLVGSFFWSTCSFFTILKYHIFMMFFSISHFLDNIFIVDFLGLFLSCMSLHETFSKFNFFLTLLCQNICKCMSHFFSRLDSCQNVLLIDWDHIFKRVGQHVQGLSSS